MLKSSRIVKHGLIINSFTLFVILVFWILRGNIWTILDFQTLDIFYEYAVNNGYGSKSSERIVYLAITDETYRDYFKKNVLDRSLFSKVIDTLDQFQPAATAADIIFAYPSDSTSDNALSKSFSRNGNVYLPVAFAITTGDESDNIKNIIIEKENLRVFEAPEENGDGNPYIASRALTQYTNFFSATNKSGHISIKNDEDGILRHAIMLIKVDSVFYPTFSLSIFLDYVESSFSEVIINWGDKITIPATDDNWLNEDVIIPINEKGETYIPFIKEWSKDFAYMSIYRLMEDISNPLLYGNISTFFEGKFVLICDVATGTSDISNTPIEKDSPLVSMHAALLNSLLTNQFFQKWSFGWTLLFFLILSLILMTLSIFKSPWVIYSASVVILLFLAVFTWIEFINFNLFPVIAISSSLGIMILSLVSSDFLLISRERAFIKTAFSHYISPEVVNELLENPKSLQLGGEEKWLTVLFTDLVSFTTISENLEPDKLVRLLKLYFTYMTEIIIKHGGTIDKYIGDSIMAIFGAPLSMDDHATRAVRAGLDMEQKLADLNVQLKTEGLPEVKSRIGINTGNMVVGNIGTESVFNYTVIGDSVNLASRLEQANKMFHTSILISRFTYDELNREEFKIRQLDVIKVKGKETAVEVFEVYDLNH
ncbi:MAG: adenylate/guanylate cyclase domain-containing protein [Bacteroidetes bacterium]|nr:adenylate/guanylate cyclase domain-containing protein [Bacteroidota bacterium]